MSMVRCRCDRLIDSDYDVECFTRFADGTDGPILCESCRDDEMCECGEYALRENETLCSNCTKELQ